MAAPLAKITMTVPKPMLKAADRIAAAEYRTRAEVFREALREYIGRRKSDSVAPRRAMTREEVERAAAAIPYADEPDTAEERRRVREAEAAVARGEFVTLDELKADLAKRTRKGRGRVATRRRPLDPKAA